MGWSMDPGPCFVYVRHFVKCQKEFWSGLKVERETVRIACLAHEQNTMALPNGSNKSLWLPHEQLPVRHE